MGIRTRVKLPTASAASIWNAVSVPATSAVNLLSVPALSGVDWPLTTSGPSRTLSNTVPSSRIRPPARAARSITTTGPSRSTTTLTTALASWPSRSLATTSMAFVPGPRRASWVKGWLVMAASISCDSPLTSTTATWFLDSAVPRTSIASALVSRPSAGASILIRGGALSTAACRRRAARERL